MTKVKFNTIKKVKGEWEQCWHNVGIWVEVCFFHPLAKSSGPTH